jgi:beta-galactosidase
MRKATEIVFVLLVIASAAFAAPPRQAAKTFDLIRWNGGKFVYGVDYYPEAWPESQWEKDAAMMQAAGINFVRLAEFSWAKMEPEEGKFDFGWLDRALKVLNAHGIRAVLGTPTASPPAWLYAKYPDIAAMDENGVRYRFGSRRNYCLHSPHFIAATRSIVNALAEHYKNHPGVLGWQIDNEVGGPYCYDEYCRRAFQDWCRAEYRTLDALNQAWGTIFWGHTYSAWSQVPLPWNTLYGAHNPSLALDYHRFFSDSTRDYVKLQADMLRELAPGKAITTNEMGMFDGVDYSELNRQIDFVAWDSYPMFDQDPTDYFSTALSHDLMRGSKNNQNYMVMEEQGGLPGWTTFWGHQDAPAYYRLWTYQAIAHGADGICYFRWRTSRYGTEQYWQGVLEQDSYPNARYQIVAQTGKEIEKLTAAVEGSRPASEVAMLVSPDSRWAFHIQPLTKNFDYNRQLKSYYAAFRRMGVNADVIFPGDDISNYKILVAPSLFVVDAPLAAKLSKFVEGGGTLVLTYRSGVKDEHNVFTDLTLPGPLASLAGVAIHDYDPETSQKQEIELGGKTFPASAWFDILTPATAESIATYGKGYYAGRPAITLNHSGSGSVFYVGTESTSADFYDQLAARAGQAAGLARGPELPKGVEMAVRRKGKADLIFLMNFTDTAQTVSLNEKTHNAETGLPVPAEVTLKPLDAVVLVAP